MNQFAVFGKKKYWNLLIPLGLTLAYFLLTARVFNIRYETNDDAILCNIAAGAYGADSQHLIFIHVLIGWLMKPLIHLGGQTNWLMLFTTAIGVLSLSVLGKLLLDRVGRLSGTVLFALLLLFLGPPFFCTFSFTKHAALATATGGLLVWTNLGSMGKRTSLGIALVCLGSMLRFEFYLIAGGMAAIPLASSALTRAAGQRRTALLTLAALVILPLALLLADRLAYWLRPDWKEFLDFSLARSEFMDYRTQQWIDPARLAGAGLSENDSFILQKWAFYEPSFFTTELFQELSRMIPAGGQDFSRTFLLSTAQRFFFTGALSPGHTLLLLLLPFFVDKRKRLPTLGILLSHFVMICFLCWRGRFLPRVQDSMMVASAVLLLGCLRPISFAPAKRRLILAPLVAALALPGLMNQQAGQQLYLGNHVFREALTDRALTLQEEEPAFENSLFLVNVLLVSDLNGYLVWQTKPVNAFADVVFISSWLMNAPFQKDALARYGVVDPYRDSIDRYDVFWVEEGVYVTQKETFIQEHYAPEARFVLLAASDAFGIYLVSDGPLEESAP